MVEFVIGLAVLKHFELMEGPWLSYLLIAGGLEVAQHFGWTWF